MAQLVSNLIGNAVQHGHQHTPVKITATGNNPDSVTVVVENQGPAIPLARRSSIFDPLYGSTEATSDDHRGRLGLGLYIAKEIALAHEGDVNLLSSDESGTLFEVRLPRVAPLA